MKLAAPTDFSASGTSLCLPDAVVFLHSGGEEHSDAEDEGNHAGFCAKKSGQAREAREAKRHFFSVAAFSKELLSDHT
jgi:hypothetical protein